MPIAVRTGPVSPGLTSRPSLSDHALQPEVRDAGRVAGINLPAFVERPPRPTRALGGMTSPERLAQDRSGLAMTPPMRHHV